MSGTWIQILKYKFERLFKIREDAIFVYFNFN